ncbi:MAG: histidine kinase dimerization/phosphoacceptor domain -containing protein [SAR324 cluster bacterium]|nr:histidine kinase dimerization/phosphoacceptor domain -containing protein [SAR324 cluster bacterium]
MKAILSTSNHRIFDRQTISSRLIIFILLASSLITLLGTAYQLYTDYRRDVGLIEERMIQIQSSYLRGIVNSLWMTDLRQAEVLLEGVVQLPDMEYIEIQSPEGVWLKHGRVIEEQVLEYRFPLQYIHQAEEFDLGELRLLASLDDVYARLWDKLLIILLTQAIKTFLISGFILVLVQLLITRHLGSMARYAHEVTPEKLDAPLILQRKQRNDELNEVVVAFNRMRKSLQDYYQQLRSELTRRTTAEKELLDYKNKLEEQVVERTEELRAANQKLQEEINERSQAEKRLTASLHEKDVLLQEVHHRVKNNMQIISSMLRLQFRNTKDEHLDSLMSELQQRIHTMSLVHEKLYQSTSLSHIDLPDFISHLSQELLSSFGVSADQVSLKLDLEPMTLDVNCIIPCGLIINELITNSLKYAFAEERKGGIEIRLKMQENQRVFLSVCDDGPGIPEETNWEHSQSTGMRLIHILSEQLKGEYTLKNDDGTCFELIFREKNE